MGNFQKANNLYNNKDYKKAIELYKLAAEEKENESASFYNAAVCFIKLKSYVNAIDLLKEALSLKSDNKYFFNLAYCYMMVKNYKKALIYFNLAWSLNNDDTECEKAIKIILKNINKNR